MRCRGSRREGPRRRRGAGTVEEPPHRKHVGIANRLKRCLVVPHRSAQHLAEHVLALEMRHPGVLVGARDGAEHHVRDVCFDGRGQDGMALRHLGVNIRFERSGARKHCVHAAHRRTQGSTVVKRTCDHVNTAVGKAPGRWLVRLASHRPHQRPPRAAATAPPCPPVAPSTRMGRSVIRRRYSSLSRWSRRCGSTSSASRSQPPDSAAAA